MDFLAQLLKLLVDYCEEQEQMRFFLGLSYWIERLVIGQLKNKLNSRTPYSPLLSYYPQLKMKNVLQIQLLCNNYYEIIYFICQLQADPSHHHHKRDPFPCLSNFILSHLLNNVWIAKYADFYQTFSRQKIRSWKYTQVRWEKLQHTSLGLTSLF